MAGGLSKHNAADGDRAVCAVAAILALNLTDEALSSSGST